MLFGFLELFVRGVVFNILLAALVQPRPVDLNLRLHPSRNHLPGLRLSARPDSWWHYLQAIVYPIATYLIVVQYILVGRMSNPDSKYPFTDEEMARLRSVAAPAFAAP
jgi:hypothetical protein